jgi:hypothetical protein
VQSATPCSRPPRCLRSNFRSRRFHSRFVSLRYDPHASLSLPPPPGDAAEIVPLRLPSSFAESPGRNHVLIGATLGAGLIILRRIEINERKTRQTLALAEAYVKVIHVWRARAREGDHKLIYTACASHAHRLPMIPRVSSSLASSGHRLLLGLMSSCAIVKCESAIFRR